MDLENSVSLSYIMLRVEDSVARFGQGAAIQHHQIAPPSVLPPHHPSCICLSNEFRGHAVYRHCSKVNEEDSPFNILALLRAIQGSSSCFIDTSFLTSIACASTSNPTQLFNGFMCVKPIDLLLLCDLCIQTGGGRLCFGNAFWEATLSGNRSTRRDWG